ncbi:MAG TPA: replicative DNA helicase [Blastocatellia bacterium]|nr:replicative DNA helicase [Blastocatellia bacterium]
MALQFARDITLDKSLPNNVDAERSILGAILLDNAVCNQAVEFINRDDFYLDSHRRIFDKMIQLSEKGSAIDYLTVAEALQRSGELEQVGGISFLSALTDGVPRTANIEHYARIVKGKSVLRRLINEANKIIATCFEAEEDPQIILDNAEKAIFALAEDRIREGFTHLKPVLHQQLEAVEKMAGRENMLTGVPTGFTEFDKLTNGLQKTDLIIIAARPSTGKTSLVLNMVQNAALKYGAVAGVFSLEMSKQQLVQRMLCSESQVDAQRFRNGFLNKEEWGRLAEGLAHLAEGKIFIDDTPGISILEMRAKARRLKAEHGLDMLVVDYLQLMSGRGRTESRQQEVSQISRDLKALAKELDVPVIALSQLSRAPETRTNHEPQLSDLRESGSIEQDADIVAFIFREEMYNETEENKGIAQLLVRKNRNGPTNDIKMVFIKQFTRFENLWQEF